MMTTNNDHVAELMDGARRDFERKMEALEITTAITRRAIQAEYDARVATIELLSPPEERSYENRAEVDLPEDLPMEEAVEPEPIPEVNTPQPSPVAVPSLDAPIWEIIKNYGRPFTTDMMRVVFEKQGRSADRLRLVLDRAVKSGELESVKMRVSEEEAYTFYGRPASTSLNDRINAQSKENLESARKASATRKAQAKDVKRGAVPRRSL